MVFDTDAGLQGYNILIYCGNSPVNRIDVSGRASYDCVRDDDDMLDGEYVKNDGGGGYYGFDSHQAILDGNFSGSISRTTTLYRSVGIHEAQDIKTTGEFNLSNRGMESKQFGFSFEETAIFGKKVGQSTIISAKIPTDALHLFDSTQVDQVIFRSGTMTVYKEMLHIFNQLIAGTIKFLTE